MKGRIDGPKRPGEPEQRHIDGRVADCPEVTAVLAAPEAALERVAHVVRRERVPVDQRRLVPFGRRRGGAEGADDEAAVYACRPCRSSQRSAVSIGKPPSSTAWTQNSAAARADGQSSASRAGSVSLRQAASYANKTVAVSSSW